MRMSSWAPSRSSGPVRRSLTREVTWPYPTGALAVGAICDGRAHGGARPMPSPSIVLGLLEVFGEVLVHFEHADRRLAVEYGLQLVVGENLALVLRVLQVV